MRQIAQRFSDASNPSMKLNAGALYERYDQYLSALADQPVTLLELGVYSGESLKTFASYFAKGRIVGIDITDRGADFSDFPNIAFRLCDQRDAQTLGSICSTLAPDGLDIIDRRRIALRPVEPDVVQCAVRTPEAWRALYRRGLGDRLLG
jgi:hypothetical protein